MIIFKFNLTSFEKKNNILFAHNNAPTQLQELNWGRFIVWSKSNAVWFSFCIQHTLFKGFPGSQLILGAEVT